VADGRSDGDSRRGQPATARLLTDRAYYADIDEAQGVILIERNAVRAGLPSLVDDIR
jgi:hypothetical protein